MDIKLLSRAYLLLYMFLTDVARALDSCNLNNRSNEHEKLTLLSRISLLTGEKFLAEGNNYTYAVSICSDVSKGHHLINASATRTRIGPSANTTTVIGRHNNTDIVGSGNSLVLIYGSGDLITEPGSCNGSRWSTVVMMTCAAKSDDLNLELLDEITIGCFAMFRLKTSILCPVPRQLSPGGAVLILLFTVLICYLLVGVAYRRIVAGAKGLEQIPHYRFWSGLIAAPYNYLTRKDESRRDENWRPQEQADEPLLSP